MIVARERWRSAVREKRICFLLSPGPIGYLEVTFEYLCGQQALTMPFHELLAAYAGTMLPALPYPQHLDARRAQCLTGLMQGVHDQLSAHHTLSLFCAEATMAQLFAFLVCEVHHGRQAEGQDDTRDLLSARFAIERRYRERITIEELASDLQLSPGYFSRAFKARFGMAPIAYQLTLRINAAKNLLVTTMLSCKEIAYRTGFADQYHFSKAFKQATGVSPTAYRGASGQA